LLVVVLGLPLTDSYFFSLFGAVEVFTSAISKGSTFCSFFGVMFGLVVVVG
jgi:hypothetical protein